MNINENIQELAERMGAATNRDEAERMAVLLKQRGITTFEQLDEMNHSEFFRLIPDSLSDTLRQEKRE
jgi:hypothetical protein